MNKINITYNNKNIIAEFSGKKSIYDVLLEQQIPILSPCGGKGTCGKCIVHADGTLQIACTTLAIDGMNVDVALQGGAKILADGIDISLKTNEQGYGVAIDVGTTTIVAYLYELHSGCRKQVVAQLNAQRSWGSDIIVRTEHSETMHKLLIEQLNEIISNFDFPIKKVFVVGNTIMMHFLMGLDARPIAVAPFTPKTINMHKFKACDLGMNFGGTVTAMPGVAGYVGSDVVAGILSSGMYNSNDISLLIDIGTNGEIVLGNKDRLISCATAAGPAFEGANISCGVGSVSGAVSSCQLDEGEIQYTTIDDAPPIGICGSGLLDAVSVLIDKGIVDETGYMEDAFTVCPGVEITPHDIRELQLAKAAICAGILTLIKKAEVSLDDIKNIYLAGGFGSYMDKKNAVKIGLIPPSLDSRVKTVGNAAGSGGIMAMLSSEYEDICKKIAQKTEYIELSGNSDFQNEYMEQMMLY